MSDFFIKSIEDMIQSLPEKTLSPIYFFVRSLYNGEKVARRCGNTDEQQRKTNPSALYTKGE